MSMATNLGLTDTASWCVLFLFLATIVYHIRAKYLKPYHFNDDEKELLIELLDERMDQAQIFDDSDLKEDIYLLKQKIRR